MFYATLREYLLCVLPGTNASDRTDLTRKAVQYATEKKDTELLLMAAIDHSMGSRIRDADTTLEDFTLNNIPQSVTEQQFVDQIKEFYHEQGFVYRAEYVKGLHLLLKNEKSLVANISFAHDHCFVTINNYSAKDAPKA